jgi:hypothetical protein
MVYGLLFAQLGLPAAMLVGLFTGRFRSRAAWLAGMVAAAAVLALLALMGLWIVPPAWAWMVYAAGLLAAALAGGRRWSAMPALPRTVGAWAFVVLAAAVAVYATHGAVRAWQGREPPAGESVELAFPLREGRYLVLNGGDDLRINAHLATRDRTVPRFARWRGNGYGVDVVALDRWGARARGLRPTANAGYAIFGRDVIAPCEGEVITAVDGLPDMTPPRHDAAGRLAGNHVVLACAGFHVLLAHLREGSLRVRGGERVVAGQPLGQVGNSGGSDEAHLHVHVQRPGTPDAPFGGEPVPATYRGHFLVRGDEVEVAAGGALRVSPAVVSAVMPGRGLQRAGSQPASTLGRTR